MIVELKEGEVVEIQFEGTDGKITVGFSPVGSSLLPAGISIHADIPDSSGREGVIYHEAFATVEAIKTAIRDLRPVASGVLGFNAEDAIPPFAPIYRRNPIPEGCETCAGCPDCLTNTPPTTLV